ncbi:hypothetical protein [Paractinoplanes globisporus]|uniref:Uncharacterized protein n=1 Tax=Paractinoplanes globisporus TaxID=113565 RepID=A0ABW6WBL2_9ACTN|nr:hypothetical protein [Actinoplanes globisporus]
MSTNTPWQSFETRLGTAADAVDAVVARIRDAHVAGNGRRADALRADEAQLRTRLRELRAAGRGAWERHGAGLDRDLDRLRTETAVAAARLDTELAADPGTFTAAAGAELAARRAQIDVLATSTGAIDALKTGLRRAMAELDDGADLVRHNHRRTP